VEDPKSIEALKAYDMLSTSELQCINENTTAAVDLWVASQDEAARQFHEMIVFVNQEQEEMRARDIVYGVCDLCPDLRRSYSREALTNLANELLVSEFADLSKIFTALFDDYNLRFFQGSCRLIGCV
jgi:hypothetical protein